MAASRAAEERDATLRREAKQRKKAERHAARACEREEREKARRREDAQRREAAAAAQRKAERREAAAAAGREAMRLARLGVVVASSARALVPRRGQTSQPSCAPGRARLAQSLSCARLPS